MRKERNERAKITTTTTTTTAKKEQQTKLSSTLRTDVGGVSKLVPLDESDTIDDEMELITPGGGGGISQGKSKIKKKKKGKR